jgi:hypothetical protein
MTTANDTLSSKPIVDFNNLSAIISETLDKHINNLDIAMIYLLYNKPTTVEQTADNKTDGEQ